MKSEVFSQFLNRIGNMTLSVLDPSIPKTKYIEIDLSESNQELSAIDVSSSKKLGNYINDYIRKHQAIVAFGGYLEVRDIYKRSQHFNGQAQEQRNIHLGIDLWCDPETPIFAPLDGFVHSFGNNQNYGDYGPTIVLRHEVNDIEFFSLYGHLSLISITDLKVGKFFEQGALIATLGGTTVNGDYPPHLHFQIINDLQGFKGDYPGVCSKTDLEFYKTNCPNPNLFLKL